MGQPITLDVLGERLSNFQDEVRGDIKVLKSDLREIKNAHAERIKILEANQLAATWSGRAALWVIVAFVSVAMTVTSIVVGAIKLLK